MKLKKSEYEIMTLLVVTDIQMIISLLLKYEKKHRDEINIKSSKFKQIKYFSKHIHYLRKITSHSFLN